MTCVDIWNAVIEKASAAGMGALAPAEKTIYRVNRFIAEFVGGGLSGFLYNISPDWTAVADLRDEVRKIGADDIGLILEDVIVILSRPGTSEVREETWAQFLGRIDPDGELRLIEERLEDADSILWDHLERFTETNHEKG